MASKLELAGEERFYYDSENLMDYMGSLSLTNEYKVSVRWFSTRGGGGSGELARFVENYVTAGARSKNLIDKFDFGFYASEAVLPGSNLVSQEIYGNYQGVNQSFAVSRQYPEVEVTFYVDANHNSLLVLQAWQEFINPTYGGDGVAQRKKLRYADEYKCDVVIQKFNRDFFEAPKRNDSPTRSETTKPDSISYTLKRAFPTKIIATPISYGEAQIVKTIVSFSYEQYLMSKVDRGQTKDLRLPPR